MTKELLRLTVVLFYMTGCLKYGLAIAFVVVLGRLPPAWAQAAETSAIEQQQAAIQSQITQGITNGTLSAEQIQALQAQSLALRNGGTGSAAAAAPTDRAGLGRVGTGTGETLSPLDRQSVLEHGTGGTISNAPIRTQTGPDPFTYNILGPDAYQSQKYPSPEYAVPAYPTTNPQPPGTEQQYSAPSAGSPYGAGYGQASGGNGVYVYHPSMSR